MKTLILKKHRAWGWRYYPICETSHLICDLLGRKSLTKWQIELIQKHGWAIEFKIENSKSERSSLPTNLES